MHVKAPRKVKAAFADMGITDVDAMMGAMTLEVKKPVVVVYTAQPYAHGFCAQPCSHGFFLYIPNRDLDSASQKDLW